MCLIEEKKIEASIAKSAREIVLLFFPFTTKSLTIRIDSFLIAFQTQIFVKTRNSEKTSEKVKYL